VQLWRFILADWTGIFLSVPIGISIIIVTPKFQDWYGSFSKRMALRIRTTKQSEYNQVVSYKENPHAFTQYLIAIILQEILIASLIAVGVGFLLWLGQLSNIFIPA